MSETPSQSLMDTIYARAKAAPQRFAFPEADDAKMMTAAYRAMEEGLGQSVLVGDPAALRALALELGFDADRFEYVDTGDDELRARLAKEYCELPVAMFWESLVVRRLENPLYFALVMEALGMVDVTFGGFSSTSADMIQAATEIVGTDPSSSTISSVGIEYTPHRTGPEGPYIAVADVSTCVDPSPEELASIAIDSSDTLRELLGWDVRAAMLCFSTDGSAAHEKVDRVREAVRIANERRPDLKIDGEMQLDAALVPETAAKKMHHESEVAGRANLLVFPDLNAGNIGVKLIEQFGEGELYGVIMQGFNKVCSDSSRGASVEELLGNIAICGVRAAMLKERAQTE